MLLIPGDSDVAIFSGTTIDFSDTTGTDKLASRDNIELFCDPFGGIEGHRAAN
jgi:hypothetical protein